MCFRERDFESYQVTEDSTELSALWTTNPGK